MQDEARRWLRRARRVPGWLIQAVFGAALLGFALWWVDLGDVGRTFSRAHYQWVLLAIAIYALTRVVHTVHWQVYLVKVGRVPLIQLLGAFVIGNFVNSVLPARAGDVATIQFVANRYGLSRAGMIAASGVETVLDALVLVIMMLVALALLNVSFVSAVVLWALVALAAAACVAAVVGSRLIPPAMPRWRWLDFVPNRARGMLRDAWPQLHDGLEAVRDERILAVVLVLTVVGYGMEVLTFWAFGRAFSLGLPLAAYVSVTVAVSFVRTFPVTFQNIGTYEVVLLGLLKREGVAAGDAFAYAVATRILISASITVMGLLAMWLMAVRPRDVFALRRDTALPAPSAGSR
jgi:uncharacterized protein (TIRG00374 family)